MLLQSVRRMQEKYLELLEYAKTEIDALVACVTSHNSETIPSEKTAESAAALHYLANPSDGTFDFFRGIGLADDLEVIRDVFARHFCIDAKS
jgi:uncharacterized membrane protein YkvA (DUF1232 family)